MLVEGPDGLPRCGWCVRSPEYVAYHDAEWGRPLRGDAALYERIALEGFQSGLSWLTILRKRPAFRAAFRDFQPESVAAFGAADVARLLADPGIVRNRRKIEATIGNARVVAAMRERGGEGALTELVWRHAPGSHRRPASYAEIPAATPESQALARELKAAGMAFVGPTTMYALMQACGLVNDHVLGCGTAP